MTKTDNNTDFIFSPLETVTATVEHIKAMEAMKATRSMADMRHQIIDFPMMQFHRIRKVAEDTLAEINRIGGMNVQG